MHPCRGRLAADDTLKITQNTHTHIKTMVVVGWNIEINIKVARNGRIGMTQSLQLRCVSHGTWTRGKTLEKK